MKKNALLSFISTLIITAAEPLIQVSLQLSAGYYNQVKTESAKFILQMFWLILPCAAFLLVRRVYILKSDWTLRRQTTLVHPILHWSSSSSCLLSSHPAICIYNPERCTQVLDLMSHQIIGICYWHKYLINAKAVFLHIRNGLAESK